MDNKAGHYWQSSYIDWICDIPKNWSIFVFYTRKARQKAVESSIVEALCLLRNLDASALRGGPLSEKRGVFWIAIPSEKLGLAINLLPRLGYTYTVDILRPVARGQRNILQSSRDRMVRWHKKTYRLVCVYKEDEQVMQKRAPDRRTFMLENYKGKILPIRGYRGDSKNLSRRGLPVCDARLLVNLVSGRTNEKLLFLDPFAGVGGIILEAITSGYLVFSSDSDPILRYGLSHFGALHSVADARHLPFIKGKFDAIATEPPYHKGTESTIVDAIYEMYRVLKEGGRLSILCSNWQSDILRRAIISLKLKLYLDSSINRKGLDVVILACQKGD
ncbi:hypothetical protein KAW65_03920 [candidate division WOR-3 bacterium]|nr:hypothetical protein [candidate division WOR-3 bacterium]